MAANASTPARKHACAATATGQPTSRQHGKEMAMEPCEWCGERCTEATCEWLIDHGWETKELVLVGTHRTAAPKHVDNLDLMLGMRHARRSRRSGW